MGVRTPARARFCIQPTALHQVSSTQFKFFKQQFSIGAQTVFVTTFLTSVSEFSGYSSGYESEAASSECLSVDDGSEVEKDATQRRVRTKFTPEQINKLEKIFTKHKYLDAGERVKTAQKLNLTETQVRGDSHCKQSSSITFND